MELNSNGRCRYGLGMKTAACWLGNRWTVRTKKLGETTELLVEIDVATIAAGETDLPTRELGDQDADQHYTILEITDLNRLFDGKHLDAAGAANAHRPTL